MSQTVSIGVVGPSHWAYMASVMADRLKRIKEGKETSSARIPLGVYRDAREFFKLVLEAAGDQTPIDPPASVNAYALAADAVRSVRIDASRAEVEEALVKQKTLLDRIQDSRPLTDEELETVGSLREFFLWLKQEGESEAYERVVADQSIGLRIR